MAEYLLTDEMAGSVRGGEMAKRAYVRDAIGQFATTGSTAAAASLSAGHSTTVKAHELAGALDHLIGHDGPVDLTNLHVTGTHLFGGDRLGIARADMPQVPKPHRAAFLNSLGVGHREESVDPRTIKPTQREMDAVSVAKLARKMRHGEFQGGHPTLVSSDGYVLDGHHRWAAYVTERFRTGETSMPITRIDMPIRDLLKRGREYNAEHGVQTLALGEKRVEKMLAAIARLGGVGIRFAPGLRPVLKYDPSQPRDGEGQWTSGGTGMTTHVGARGTKVHVDPTAGVTKAQVDVQMGVIDTLQRIAPVDGLEVTISDAPFEAAGLPESTMGFVRPGSASIHLRPRAVTEGVDHSSGLLMPVLGGQPQVYTITHEYGHVLDHRSDQRASDDKGLVIGSRQTGMSRYASADEDPRATGREAFAEAFVGWVGSQGRMGSTHAFVGYFADTYGWDAGDGSRPPSVPVAKAWTLLADTFTAEGSIVLPGDALKAYNPQQPRDRLGRWAAGGVSLAPEISSKAIRLVGENGGLSIKMNDGSEPPDGFMVARDSGKWGTVVTADEFYGPNGGKVLGDFLKRHRAELGSGRAYLGLWHQTSEHDAAGVEHPLDRKDQKVHLDVTDRVVGRDRAVRLGRRRNQISVWDVANFEEIPTGGTGGEVVKGLAGLHEPEAARGDDRRGDRRLGGGGPPGDGRSGPLLIRVAKRDYVRDQVGRFAVTGGGGSSGGYKGPAKGLDIPPGCRAWTPQETHDYWAGVAQHSWEMEPEAARGYAARLVDQADFYEAPNSTLVRIDRAAAVSPARAGELLGNVAHMQSVAPVHGQHVEVGTDAFTRFGADPSWGGFAMTGRPEVYLHPRAVQDGLRFQEGNLMPEVGRAPRLYALAHEWGHTIDKRDDTRAAIDHARISEMVGKPVNAVGGPAPAAPTPGARMSQYGLTNKRESYAEAFASWAISPAGRSNPAVQHFSETYRWGDGDSRIAKAATVIMCGDTFDERGPVIREVPTVPPMPLADR